MTNMIIKWVTLSILAIYGSSTSAENQQLADPTMPAGYQSASQSTNNADFVANAPQGLQLQLNSTLIDPHQKIAIINGKQLNVGDEIEGAKVTSIGHQIVRLNYQGKTITITLQRSFISNIH
ncbi:MAG: hypothetical protein COB23_09130 [Methylophaga sp.]|nr:MAG: hypothetical protein COB23_09130 [Methylophaga sp.]